LHLIAFLAASAYPALENIHLKMFLKQI